MKKKQLVEKIAQIVFTFFGLLSIFFVLLITIYLVVSGVPAIKEIGLFNFLFGKTWASTAAEPKFGILPFILSSFYATLFSTAIATVIGLFTAIFISRYASKAVRNVVDTLVNLLSAIPSVVIGFVGMIVLVPTIRKIFNLSDGACLLSAIVVLTIMIIPNVIKVSVTAIDAVSDEYENASIALAATKEETIMKVTLPKAKSGIISSVVLAMSRAIGESMAVVMVSGNVANMPSLFSSVRFLTTAIASEMSYATVGSLQRKALFSIALVLYVFIMLMNALLQLIVNKGENKQ